MFYILYFLDNIAQYWQDGNKEKKSLWSTAVKVLIGLIFLEGNFVIWIKSFWLNLFLEIYVQKIIWNIEKPLCLKILIALLFIVMSNYIYNPMPINKEHTHNEWLCKNIPSVTSPAPPSHPPSPHPWPWRLLPPPPPSDCDLHVPLTQVVEGGGTRLPAASGQNTSLTMGVTAAHELERTLMLWYWGVWSHYLLIRRSLTFNYLICFFLFPSTLFHTFFSL